MIALRPVALNEFTSSIGRHTTASQLCRQGTHKLENTTISSMMLTKGLIIPAEHQHISPSIAKPVGIGISIERETIPTLVGEAIPDIITEIQVTSEQKGRFVLKLYPVPTCSRTQRST